MGELMSFPLTTHLDKGWPYFKCSMATPGLVGTVLNGVNSRLLEFQGERSVYLI